MDGARHYHICWSQKGLDWEPFETHAESEKAAKQLASPGETFAIEEHGDGCSQCTGLITRSRAPGDSSNDLSA